MCSSDLFPVESHLSISAKESSFEVSNRKDSKETGCCFSSILFSERRLDKKSVLFVSIEILLFCSKN